MQKLVGLMRKAIQKYDMIQAGDRIAVGVSGGKDSVVKATVNPTEILLVVDAMIGQDAVNAAKAFDDALDIDGVVAAIRQIVQEKVGV